MIPDRVDAVVIATRDVRRLRAFYEALGWTSRTSRTRTDYVRFDLRTGALALWTHAEAEEEFGRLVASWGGEFSGVLLVTVVESPSQVDEAADAVQRAGGRVVSPPTAREWGGRSAYFVDPDGTAWEVVWIPGASFDARDLIVWPPPDSPAQAGD